MALCALCAVAALVQLHGAAAAAAEQGVGGRPATALAGCPEVDCASARTGLAEAVRVQYDFAARVRPTRPRCRARAAFACVAGYERQRARRPRLPRSAGHAQICFSPRASRR